MTKRVGMAAIMVLAVSGLAGTVRGGDSSVAIKAGLFLPADKLFREIYSGGPSFGVDVAVHLAGPLNLWAGAELFSKGGLIPVSEEATRVRIVPLYAGLRAQFGHKGPRPYVGAAAGYFFLHEENPLGTADDGGLGFLSQAGIQARLAGAFWLDIFAGYRACTVRSGGDDPLEAKLGGFSTGLGLAYRF
ncbi:MAG: hypothetical protein WCC00_10975 [Candidatus Aminicenantales bacterium]